MENHHGESPCFMGKPTISIYFNIFQWLDFSDVLICGALNILKPKTEAWLWLGQGRVDGQWDSHGSPVRKL